MQYSSLSRYLCLLILALSLPATVAAIGTDVLFVGNSHTAVNDLKGLFAGLAQAGGQLFYVDQSVLGSSTISYHTHYQPTLDLINERVWDHVVVQEHSLLPVIPYWVENSFFPMAARMDSIVTAGGSTMTLLLHWARQAPSGTYCVFDHCSREFEDYFDMQREMSAPYRTLATELDVMLVPVGNVWAAALADDPTLPLWATDQLHPSLEGSYFTACVLYTHIFDESPVGLDFHGGLSEERAAMYQQLSWPVLSGAPQTPEPWARLLPSYPNPFNPATTIRFELARTTDVELSVQDLAGRLVKSLVAGELPAGEHEVRWHGRDDAGRAVSSGTYVYRLWAAGALLERKMLLLK